MSVPVMVAVAAGAVLLGVPVMGAAGIASAGALAASAADAAALAAADAMVGTTFAEEVDPCAFAGEVAELHGGHQVRCDLDPEQFEVRVTVGVRVGLVHLAREARAGPPPVPLSGHDTHPLAPREGAALCCLAPSVSRSEPIPPLRLLGGHLARHASGADWGNTLETMSLQ